MKVMLREYFFGKELYDGLMAKTAIGFCKKNRAEEGRYRPCELPTAKSM